MHQQELARPDPLRIFHQFIPGGMPTEIEGIHLRTQRHRGIGMMQLHRVTRSRLAQMPTGTVGIGMPLLSA